jgi:hypothetical protein
MRPCPRGAAVSTLHIANSKMKGSQSQAALEPKSQRVKVGEGQGCRPGPKYVTCSLFWILGGDSLLDQRTAISTAQIQVAHVNAQTQAAHINAQIQTFIVGLGICVCSLGLGIYVCNLGLGIYVCNLDVG